MARNFCKHYQGMHGKDLCKAGIAFAKLENHGTKHFRDSCPCFGPEQSGNCELKEYRTDEEMAADDARILKRFENTSKARSAIIEVCGKFEYGSSVSGIIDCPICNGKEALSFSRSGYNGHIHARCETKDCVRWME